MTEEGPPESNLYELTFLLEKEGDLTQVKNILEKNKAVVTHERQPVRARLSYPMKKQREGFLCSFEFQATSDTLDSLLKDAPLRENTLRFLINRVRISGQRKSQEPIRPITDIGDTREKKRVNGVQTTKSFDTVLTNEALEKKIEEILK